MEDRGITFLFQHPNHRHTAMTNTEHTHQIIAACKKELADIDKCIRRRNDATDMTELLRCQAAMECTIVNLTYFLDELSRTETSFSGTTHWVGCESEHPACAARLRLQHVFFDNINAWPEELL